MVGPGTGVAPFRGFLQARAALKKEGVPLGEAHLYFGCGNDADYLYREELDEFERDGIARVHIAFSRAPGMSKVYVQHLLERDSSKIINLLSGRGKLYVCGDGSKMAPDVEAALKKAYRDVRGAGQAEADEWLNRVQAEGCYVKDVWSWF
ncbi:hypothetical protein Q3F21_11200 [Brevibacillus borstelensis]